jgi:hypothetical protein
MHQYHITFGILLILPIIDIAVAAPVLVQEKLQPGVDVVHKSGDAMTMLGKRAGELEDLFRELFGDTSRSSSRPPSPADGWADLKKSPSPNPEEPSPAPSSPAPSSITNTGPLMESSSPSTTSSTSMKAYAYLDSEAESGNWLRRPAHTPTSLGYGSDHELTGVHAQQLSPDPRPPTYTDLDWKDGTNLENPPPPISASPKEFGQAHDTQVEQVQRPNQQPSTSTVSDVDWKAPLSPKKRPIPTSSNAFGQADGYHQAEHVQKSSQRPSIMSDVGWNRRVSHFWFSDRLAPSKKRPKLASSESSARPFNENQVVYAQRPDTGMSSRGLSNPGHSNPGLPSEPGDES